MGFRIALYTSSLFSRDSILKNQKKKKWKWKMDVEENENEGKDGGNRGLRKDHRRISHEGPEGE